MNIYPLAIDRALSRENFNKLQHDICTRGFLRYSLDSRQAMFVTQAPDWVVGLLKQKIEDAYGCTLKTIAAFIRRNDVQLDTEFRVHSDGSILNQKVDMGAVYYLHDHPNGTALFEHPIAGTKSTSGTSEVFTKDDGLWKPTVVCDAVENRLFTYDGSCFHQRHPAHCLSRRDVLIMFFSVSK